jgi:hypothetical protein
MAAVIARAAELEKSSTQQSITPEAARLLLEYGQPRPLPPVPYNPAAVGQTPRTQTNCIMLGNFLSCY